MKRRHRWGMTVDVLLHHYRRIATVVTARQLDARVSRHAGEDDLLVLKEFNGVRILTVAQAIEKPVARR